MTDQDDAASLRAIVERLEARVAELEAERAERAEPVAPVDAVDPGPGGPPRSRRDLLRLAGLAVAGGVGAVVAGSEPAAAADGDAIVIGSTTNNGSTSTVLSANANYPTGALITFLADANSNTNNIHGLTTRGSGGRAGVNALGGASGGTGVMGAGGNGGGGVVGSGGGGAGGVGVLGLGTVDNEGVVGLGAAAAAGVAGVGGFGGIGVRGTGGQTNGTGLHGVGGTGNGIGVLATGTGTAAAVAVQPAPAGPHAAFAAKAAAGPPVSGAHLLGELWVDSAGVLWTCVGSSTPGAWARLTSVVSTVAGGAVNLLPKPIRLLDTRLPSGGSAKYQPQSAHDLTVANGPDINDVNSVRIPAGAVAAVLNITVTEASGAGHVRAYPANPTPPTTSVLNFVAGIDVANGATVGLTGGKIGLFLGGGPAHLVVDASAYVL